MKLSEKKKKVKREIPSAACNAVPGHVCLITRGTSNAIILTCRRLKVNLSFSERHV